MNTDVDSHTLIVGDLHRPLLTMDRPSKQRINKDIEGLNNTLDQMDLIYIYRTFQPKEAKCTFFSNAHDTFSKIDHMIGHKTSLNKFKKIEIVLSNFLDHNVLNLKSTSRKNPQKHSNTWAPNNMLLNNEWVINEIKEEIKKFLKTNENEHTIAQNLWDTAKAVLRRKFIVIQAYLKKIEKFQVNNLTLHLQELEE